MKTMVRAGAIAFLLPFLLSCANQAEKSIIVTAEQSKQCDGAQQLWLQGVKSPGALGIRVYMTTTAQGKDVGEDSRVGTVFFSHPGDGSKGQTFVIPLPAPVTGKKRIVIVPITKSKQGETAPVQLESAEIKSSADAGRQ